MNLRLLTNLYPVGITFIYFVVFVPDRVQIE